MDWMSRADGGFTLTIPKGDYSQEQHQWAKDHPRTGLVCGAAEAEGQAIVLTYPPLGLPLLLDQVPAMDERAVLNALCSIAAMISDVEASGVLLLCNVQADSSMVYVRPEGGAALLYASVLQGRSDVTAEHVKSLLLDTIRRAVQKYQNFATDDGKQLLELINDPYMSLSSVCALLNQMSNAAQTMAYAQAIQPQTAPYMPAPQPPMGNGTVAMHQGGAADGMINAAVHGREMRIQPVQTAGLEQTVRNALEMQLQAAPVQQTNYSMPPQETSMQSRPVSNMLNYGADAPTSDAVATLGGEGSSPLLNYSADIPTQDDAPMPAYGGLSYGADAPTSDAGYPAGAAALNYGADAPTSDAGVPMSAPAPVQSPAPARREEPKPEKKAKPEKASKPEKAPKAKAEKPKKEKPRKEKPVQEPAAEDDEPLTHEELVHRCWTNRMILLVAAVGVILFMIILLSFASPFVVLLFLLAVAAGAAFVGKQGFFGTLVMPKLEKAEPVAPTLGEVFNVRMKLQSVNLGSVVEVTIRQREQILGSSEQLASKPVLNYSGISRQHCKVICLTSAGNDTYYVEDLKSKNGTELNGMRLIPGNRYPLKYGDTLTLAHKYKFVVHSDAY